MHRQHNQGSFYFPFRHPPRTKNTQNELYAQQLRFMRHKPDNLTIYSTSFAMISATHAGKARKLVHSLEHVNELGDTSAKEVEATENQSLAEVKLLT